ncbi:hypothetical protein QUO21_004077 [Vibrio parahaemolyticus]|nr:hypothetical protein [Vibrio parahaemolyticus]
MARRRTLIKAVSVLRKADVTPLIFEDMVLRATTGRMFHLNRLRYRGVPKLSSIKSKPEQLINAGRDEQIRKLFKLSANNPSHASYMFDASLGYFRYLDSINYSGDIFDFKVMEKALEHFNLKVLKGESKMAARKAQTFLSYFLTLMGREQDICRLPEVKQASASEQLVAFTSEEIKLIARVLRKGLLSSIQFIEQSTVPDIHPCFDDVLFERLAQKEGWSKRQKGVNKASFRNMLRGRKNLNCNVADDYRTFVNHASRIALYAFYMLTGMNTNVLASIRYSDVEFKDISGGRYVLNGVKGRASHKELDNSIGFTKRTKELIEEWLKASKLIYKSFNYNTTLTDPIFPHISTTGIVKDFTAHGTNPTHINKALSKILGFNINPSRLRKTKLDILMRVTEDMFLVSQAANNTIEVIAHSYSSGNKSDHKKNLKATSDALYSISKGESISVAVDSAKAINSDILTDYDYRERLRRAEAPVTTLTPSGIRCKGPNTEKIVSERRKAEKLGVKLPEKENTCTDFLACYDCDSHVLVASETDIWLMMTFRYQVLQVRELPAKNSVPKARIHEIEAVLAKVIRRMKEKSPDNYEKAYLKFEKGMLHPLFETRLSLKYVMDGKQ